MTDEIILTGGRSTAEVVMIGKTIHRSARPNAEFSHRLLILLEQKNFKGAPRYIGLDDKGREILSYIDGVVPKGGNEWTMAQMIKVVKMMREFHDASAGNELSGNFEVVCHNDLAPWNVVLRNDSPVALIDFDEVSPGNRVDDLAYFLWTFLNLGNDTPIDTQIGRIKVLCDQYGYSDGKKLVEAILDQQNRILEKRKLLAKKSHTKEDREFSAKAIPKIRQEIKWVKDNSDQLIEKFYE